MCYPTTCPQCKKTAWAGCGMHVRGIAAGLDAQDRCNHVSWPDMTKEQIAAAQGK